jgi:hypothetical protein
MSPEQIPWSAAFAVLFVGGSLPWKLNTGAMWARVAHANGRDCHVGRVGSAKRVRWAVDAGADSIDSSLPLWSAEKTDVFLAALDSARRQTSLFEGAA